MIMCAACDYGRYPDTDCRDAGNKQPAEYGDAPVYDVLGNL